MHCDTPRASRSGLLIVESLPVVVIGTGPSGAVAAAVLAEQGRRVTVIDSGNEGTPTGLLIRAMGRTIFRKGPGGERRSPFVSAEGDATWFHSLIAGGLSNYWTGAVPRFAPEDFHEGARLHERYRWPVTYADLVPAYERIERLLSQHGVDYVRGYVDALKDASS